MITACVVCDTPIGPDGLDPMFCDEWCRVSFYAYDHTAAVIRELTETATVALMKIGDAFRQLAAGIAEVARQMGHVCTAVRDDIERALHARHEANRLARHAPRTIGRPRQQVAAIPIVTRCSRRRM